MCFVLSGISIPENHAVSISAHEGRFHYPVHEVRRTRKSGDLDRRRFPFCKEFSEDSRQANPLVAVVLRCSNQDRKLRGDPRGSGIVL